MACLLAGETKEVLVLCPPPPALDLPLPHSAPLKDLLWCLAVAGYSSERGGWEEWKVLVFLTVQGWTVTLQFSLRKGQSMAAPPPEQPRE